MTSVTLDAASVLFDGPWHHRLVSANGARFHVAELGDGPMVLLMHGFPQFWYTWRHQMAAIADAGWRAVAMDLRGYGASDKPPRGYSTYTAPRTRRRSSGRSVRTTRSSSVRASAASSRGRCRTLQPDVVRAVGSLSMPHPRVMRRASVRERRQRQASRYLVELQRPFVPEREMTKDHAYVGEILRAWASPFGDYPTPEDVERYGNAWPCRSWPTPRRSTTAGSAGPSCARTVPCSTGGSAGPSPAGPPPPGHRGRMRAGRLHDRFRRST